MVNTQTVLLVIITTTQIPTPLTSVPPRAYPVLATLHMFQSTICGLSANQHAAPLVSFPLGLCTQASFLISANNFLQ